MISVQVDDGLRTGWVAAGVTPARRPKRQKKVDSLFFFALFAALRVYCLLGPLTPHVPSLTLIRLVLLLSDLQTRVMADENEEETWTVQHRLLLSNALEVMPSQNWPAISRLMRHFSLAASLNSDPVGYVAKVRIGL